MKMWHAIDVEVDREAEELASNELWTLEPTGLQTLQETSETLTMRAFYAAPVDATEVIARIEDALMRAEMPAVLLRRVTWSTVEDQDWLAEWKKTWEAMPVGERFMIVPSWKMATADPGDRLVIQIDPGMAFGTGTHETTRGVLQMLERYWPPSNGSVSLLDVGTGTGILSLGAALLATAQNAGVLPPDAKLVACDIDPEAVGVARENAEINRLQHEIEFHVGSASDFAGQQFDLVLANLTADVIELIATDLAAVVRPGGRLIASGILHDQLDGVLAILTPLQLSEVDRLADGEWVTVVLTRNL